MKAIEIEARKRLIYSKIAELKNFVACLEHRKNCFPKIEKTTKNYLYEKLEEILEMLYKIIYLG